MEEINTEEIFNKRKENLKEFLTRNVLVYKNQSLEEVIGILELYKFDNRLNKKSTLTHFIIDSADLDYSIGEKIIEFDNCIR
ncbi:hypothetical protein [Chryseobacterium camelliae]|uniref:hypothetical protein n=1 Tax=Chryseobacterium camelliae TaxID=1265445 RepID=UPI0028641678|nr:hypothetical protein [Chryseobacterium camelliae]MDR6517308.1 23S rRNA maturation mini-RNase III [Chryseobacterium camelliae]